MLTAGIDQDRLRQQQMSAFEQRYAGIKTEYISVSGVYNDRIVALMAAGDMPDVFSNAAPPLPSYAEKQQVLPLDPLIARDKYSLADFFAKSVEQYRWKGKLYGLLWMGFRHFFFNADGYTQAGVPAPPTRWNDPQWTWDRFLENARRLTRPGDVPRYGYTLARSTTRDWGAWVWSNGGDVFNRDGTQCVLDQPAAVEAFEFMHDLIYKHRVAPTPAEEMQSQGAARLFAGGSSATNWFVTGTMWGTFKDVSFQWDALPTPRGKSGLPPVATGGGQGWYLPSQNRNPDEAWELAKWLVSPEMMLMDVQAGQTVPGRKSVAGDPVWLSRKPPAHMSLLVEAMDYIHTDPLLLNAVDVNRIIEDNLADIWQDRRSAGEVTRDIVRLVTPLLRTTS